MFFGIVVIGLVLIIAVLWGDYIKMLIYLEIIRLIVLTVLLFGLKLDFFSLNFFFRCLIFLVCESSIGFLLFIFYIRIESEVVKKLRLIQF
jgi:hypothetical protein